MPALEGFNIVLDIAIAWGDMDAFGHVNNTMFFRYFESARIAYLDRIGFRSTDDDVGPILASTQCRFRAPLTYPDTIRVGARVVSVANDRFTHEYKLVSLTSGVVAAEGTGVVVAYNYRKNEKAALPDEVKQRILEVDGEHAVQS